MIQFKVLGTQPISVLNDFGVPEEGLRVRFAFGENQTGEVTMTLTAFLGGQGHAKIIEYIKAFNALQTGEIGE